MAVPEKPKELNRADELIIKIKDWKIKKDEAEYQAKIKEENAYYELLEKINSEYLPRIKKFFSVYNACREAGIKFALSNWGTIRIEETYNPCSVRFCVNFASSTWGYKITPDDTEITFKNDHVAKPTSQWLEKFIGNFESLEQYLYDFIDKELKN